MTNRPGGGTGDLWGKICPENWRQIPCMRSALASEDDVKSGRAAFYFANAHEIDARPEPIELPALAIQITGSGAQVPVVVIQAERSRDRCTLGVRYFDGGNGVCLLHEVEFVQDTEPRLLALLKVSPRSGPP